MTINLLDRYLSEKLIKKDKLQLLGVTCMLIASKYEEIYAPEVRDFVHITEKTYSRENIIEMEGDVLSTLKFDILTIYPVTFLERYHFLSGGDKNSLYLSNLILELSLLEYKMIEYKPSIKACSSLYLARKLLNINDNWNNFLIAETGYNEIDMYECIKDLCRIIEIVPKTKFTSSLNKYSQTEYENVTNILDNIINI